MQDQPVTAKPFSQDGQPALAAVVVFEGHHKIVSESHQSARTAQPRLRHTLKPLIQHMVQEYIGEHGAEHSALRSSGIGSFQRAFFEHPRFQPLWAPR